jgi:hypothetical protein
MEEVAGVIAEYVERLERQLAFDRALARSACREVEDHLREAAAARPADDPVAAESQAVARFGDPRAVAAELAQVAVERCSRRAGAGAILAIAAAFVAMKLRLVWYTAAAVPPTGGDWQATAYVVTLIDRYAFWTAALIGVAAWVYVVSRRSRQLLPLCGAAAGALLITVAADATLTALRLAGDPSSALVPTLTLAVEIVGAGLLVAYLGRLRGRVKATAALLDG